jgi:hypothetical protein
VVSSLVRKAALDGVVTLSTSTAIDEERKSGGRQVRSLRLARPKARSRITNGAALLPNVDRRGLWYRRYKDLCVLHLSDLGGEDAASEAEKALVRRAVCLIVELERMEQEFALAGKATSAELDTYQRAANTLRRLLVTLGLERRAKDVTLGEYLSSRRVEHADAEDVVEDAAEDAVAGAEAAAAS